MKPGGALAVPRCLEVEGLNAWKTCRSTVNAELDIDPGLGRVEQNSAHASSETLFYSRLLLRPVASSMFSSPNLRTSPQEGPGGRGDAHVGGRGLVELLAHLVSEEPRLVDKVAYGPRVVGRRCRSSHAVVLLLFVDVDRGPLAVGGVSALESRIWGRPSAIRAVSWGRRSPSPCRAFETFPDASQYWGRVPTLIIALNVAKPPICSSRLVSQSRNDGSGSVARWDAVCSRVQLSNLTVSSRLSSTASAWHRTVIDRSAVVASDDGGQVQGAPVGHRGLSCELVAIACMVLSQAGRHRRRC